MPEARPARADRISDLTSQAAVAISTHACEPVGMNFLAHLYLADITHTSFAGALLGDFVRGRLDGGFGPSLATGIALHRRVDSYTDNHPIVRKAFQRFEPPFRRYAGILADVYFDHLLARRWPQFCDAPLEAFAERACGAIRRQWPRHHPPFPAERLDRLPALLISYRTPDGIDDALAGLDARLSRASPLPGALPHLQAHDTALSADFDAFFPALIQFARNTVDGWPPRADTERG